MSSIKINLTNTKLPMTYLRLCCNHKTRDMPTQEKIWWEELQRMNKIQILVRDIIILMVVQSTIISKWPFYGISLLFNLNNLCQSKEFEFLSSLGWVGISQALLWFTQKRRDGKIKWSIIVETREKINMHECEP